MRENLIIRPETIAPAVGGDSTPIEVVGECVENATPVNRNGPRLTCSQNGVWSVAIGAGCVCSSGFMRSRDGRSCEGMLSVHVCLSPEWLCMSASVKVVSSFHRK